MASRRNPDRKIDTFVFNLHRAIDDDARRRYENNIAFADGPPVRRKPERRSRDIPCSPTRGK